MQAPERLKRWLTFRKGNRMPWWVRFLIRIRVWPALHYCRDCDGLAIDNYDGEYIFCTCLKPKPPMPAWLQREMDALRERAAKQRVITDRALDKFFGPSRTPDDQGPGA
jgi:hypothetical protein